MEKINVAELLKDCPSGMELDCTMYENVTFVEVCKGKNTLYPIYCITTDEEGNRYGCSFTKNGYVSPRKSSKCVIFPKGRTTWEGFQRPYINGDIVYTIGDSIAILGDKIGEHSESFYSHCGLFYDEFDFDVVVSPERLATEEEKEQLFRAIENNGYKWNAETKTLVKLNEPKFKVWDRIRHKNDKTIVETINYIYHDSYALCGSHSLLFKDQDMWELVPKFKVGDRIRHKCPEFRGERIVNICCDTGYFTTINDWIDIAHQDDWELVPNKFDINTLVPFESRVLVRNDESQYWKPAFWGCKRSDGYITTFGYGYTNTYGCCKYCIPYEGNEHLLGTNDDCDECYKTWK